VIYRSPEDGEKVGRIALATKNSRTVSKKGKEKGGEKVADAKGSGVRV